MKNLALARIQKMQPYQPPLNGRQSFDGLLLDFNERTLPPTNKVLTLLKQYLNNFKPQIYPEYLGLEKLLSKYANVQPNQIMVTNGTDQAIDIIYRTFCDVNDTVIIPEPTFAMYAQYAQIIGTRIISPLYNKNTFEYPIEEVLSSINSSVRLIVVCNPNNPTGTLVSLKNIETIAKKAKNAIVYIDEAYFEFSGCTATNLIAKYPNIVVSRTFSKAFGLAGLRIGYIIANPLYISEMLKVRGPYDVNQLAYIAASAEIAETTEVKKYTKEVMQVAKPLVEKFFKQNNITFYPSAGNFILFKPNNSAAVANILRRNGVAVRPQDKPNIENTLRLTIGTSAQMKIFINIYKNKVLESTAQKYAFLDRDGTLIFEPQDTYQIDSLEKLQILDGVIDGLKLLVKQGYKLVMVSNQDGLGTKSFPKKDFDIPQNAMMQIFDKAGIKFSEVFVCPHFSEQNCSCRKPKTGLFTEFLETANIDLAGSFVCGDRDSDKELAANLGVCFAPMQTNGNFYNAVTKAAIK